MQSIKLMGFSKIILEVLEIQGGMYVNNISDLTGY